MKEKLIWTESRIHNFIVSVLRAGSRKWPPKYTALSNSKVGKKTNNKTGRVAEHYKCASCKKEFPLKDVQVDHISPVVDPLVGFISWDIYINRLFCEIENLQVLCKKCHKKKTDNEKKLMAVSKKKKGN